MCNSGVARAPLDAAISATKTLVGWSIHGTTDDTTAIELKE
jgi:hypothetical protein